MNDVLIELSEYDIKCINYLSKETSYGKCITLENYIKVEDLIGLIDEIYYKLKCLEEAKEDMYIVGDEYDEVIERELLENE